MNRLRRFLGLGPGEQWATLEAAATLAVVQALLAWAPRRAWLRLVRQACSVSQAARIPETRRVELVTRSLGRASARIRSSTCLGRAVTGWVMLHRRGIPALVRLGVTGAAGDGFGAHAWLECGGQAVLGEPEPGQYVPLSVREPSSARGC
jgi:hypothetical protein